MSQSVPSQLVGQPVSTSLAPVLVQSGFSGGHLTARGRRVCALLALIPLVTAMVLSGSHRASATSTAPLTKQVVVHAGESLWDIAVRANDTQDPRKTMWEIQQLNHMGSSSLMAGQALTVPSQ